ncbi:MAG: hypothetical protein OEY34_10000, partial [Cyclobacteriaceae bacterium]|nr:hypothetical protein [Cyclobacteriaceae bacterium]
MNYKLLQYKILREVNHRRILVGFIVSLIGIIGSDFIINLLIEKKMLNLGSSAIFEITFSPEVWLATLALVLGTLIIVISIASQETPRLIHLYLNNWLSILFMWFVTLSSCHAIFFTFIGNSIHRPGSALLNTFIFLPIAVLGSLPYIFFILNYSKMDHVIEVISNQLSKEFERIAFFSKAQLLKYDKITPTAHRSLLDKVNQLMDLFSFVEYHETKKSILRLLSHNLLVFIEKKEKNQFSDHVFVLTDEIKQDIGFSNYTSFQFQKMEKRKSFFEEKVLRELGSMYNQFIKNENFELASNCCSKI